MTWRRSGEVVGEVALTAAVVATQPPGYGEARPDFDPDHDHEVFIQPVMVEEPVVVHAAAAPKK
jgi:hypothetical protein